MSFDKNRPIAMTTFKTVLGHGLDVGTALAVVDEPTAAGEVDAPLAARLFASGIASYADEVRPTPVETPEQEKARLAALAVRDSEGREVVGTDDLLVWPVDDAETGKKAGTTVTKSDLLIIAAREGAAVESDDNKPDLIAKIMVRRAQGHVANQANAESEQGAVQSLGDAGASTAPDTVQGADAHAGDTHGPAGE